MMIMASMRNGQEGFPPDIKPVTRIIKENGILFSCRRVGCGSDTRKIFQVEKLSFDIIYIPVRMPCILKFDRGNFCDMKAPYTDRRVKPTAF
jgi:hypothetical protein